MVLGLCLQVIDAISQAISQTPGCVLLDVDAGPSTNRTVYTFVGQPEHVVEGALNAARAASQLIDMSKHKGEDLSWARPPMPQFPGRACATVSWEGAGSGHGHEV